MLKIGRFKSSSSIIYLFNADPKTIYLDVINISSGVLESPSRIFRCSPIGRKWANYSAIEDDKLVPVILFVKMWTLQQKVQCALWLSEFKSVTRVQRRVLTGWNDVIGLPNSLTRTPTK
ncbi:uncharacterized protein TNCV_1206011 [Trichonephila clavipes]|nr:uncharacterized protein TNCV_1206011 [Trichonephila clavipes]